MWVSNVGMNTVVSMGGAVATQMGGAVGSGDLVTFIPTSSKFDTNSVLGVSASDTSRTLHTSCSQLLEIGQRIQFDSGYLEIVGFGAEDGSSETLCGSGWSPATDYTPYGRYGAPSPPPSHPYYNNPPPPSQYVPSGPAPTFPPTTPAPIMRECPIDIDDLDVCACIPQPAPPPPVHVPFAPENACGSSGSYGSINELTFKYIGGNSLTRRQNGKASVSGVPITKSFCLGRTVSWK